LSIVWGSPAAVTRPVHFQVRQLRFWTGDERHSTRMLDDARLGWRDFTLGGLDVRSARGMHDSMFAEPHVQHLACQLAALLAPLNSRAEFIENDSAFLATRFLDPENTLNEKQSNSSLGSGPAGGTGLSAPVFSGGERIPAPLPNRVTTDPGAAG
jgi:hypothetical protein